MIFIRKYSFLALWVVLALLVACGSEVEPTAPPSPVKPQPSATETAVQSVVAVPSPTTESLPTDDLTATPTETPVPTENPAPEAATAESEAGAAFSSPEYGIHTFMWWKPDIAERDLAMVQEMEFGWVKQAFPWRDIETLEKGKYDWYRPDLIVDMVERAGLKLLVRVDRQPFWSQEFESPLLRNAPPGDYQDFADFCSAMAERYQGRIAAYQIWNEPNLNREWGEQPPDPQAYSELLRVCYQAIKAADPQAIVVSAGLAPTGTGLPVAIPDDEFLQGMYDAGAADYFDVLGLNAPGYKAPPQVSPDEAEASAEYGAGRWFAFRHVEDMREIMVANDDGDKQVAILELGWTTDTFNPDYAWHAVTEEEQANYLVGAYQFAAENWSPWIGPMFTIYIADPFWTAEENEQWWWSITLPDGTRRPAFDALRDMDKIPESVSGSDLQN